MCKFFLVVSKLTDNTPAIHRLSRKIQTKSSSDENIRNTVTFIKKLKQSNKITNYNQIAVLFSHFKDRSAKKLEDALKKENIEVYSPRTKVFFEMYEVKLTFGVILACFKK